MQISKQTILSYLPLDASATSLFSDYCEIELGLSPKTVDNYKRFIGKFRSWLIKNKLAGLKPHELTADHVYQYKAWLARQGSSDKSPAPQVLKKTTQNYYLITLRNLLKYFAAKDIISLPADKVTLLRDKTERQIKFLNLEQLEQLLLSPDTINIIGLRDRAILETLFSTGLRVAELTALNREQLKIKAQTDFLEVAIRGKGGRIRTVYFSPRALTWLKRYLAARKDLDKALFINYSRANKTEPNASRRLTVRAVEDIVKKYVKIAGLPIMTSPHSLRHSYATDLLTNGVDLRLVQEFLGHRNIVTTQIYTHVTNKQLSEVHRKFHGGSRLKK